MPIRQKWYTMIAVLLVCMVTGLSRAGTDSPVVSVVQKENFEDGKIGKWAKYNIEQSALSMTTEALSGKYSLNLKFDDKTKGGRQIFDKGVKFLIKPAIPFSDFSSISFRYLIEGVEIDNIRIVLREDNGNLYHYIDYKPVIGKQAEFRIEREELAFWYSHDPEDDKRIIGGEVMAGNANLILISLRNKKPANSGLKFSVTLDDIVLGNELTSATILPSEVNRSPLAVAAQARGPVLIDGKLNDWSGAVPIPLTRREQIIAYEGEWGGPANFSAVSMLLWDSKHLYFAVKVRDDKVVCADSATNYDLCLNDSVRLCLRTNPTPVVERDNPLGADDYVFCASPFSPKGASPVLVLANESYRGDPHKEFPLNSVQIASSYDREGWIIEMAIPWQSLKVTPTEGKPLGFFYVIVGDSDKPCYRHHEIIWHKTRSKRYFKDSSYWGKLLLTRALTDTEAISVAAKTGAVLSTSDLLEYGMNQDITCNLDLWFPLATDEKTVTWQVINEETKKVVGKAVSLSAVKTPLSTRLAAKWNSGVTDDGNYLLLCKLSKPEQVSIGGSRFELIGSTIEEKQQKIAELSSLYIQLKQLGFSYPRAWLIDKRLYARNEFVHTQRVEPAKWSLVKDPVIWEDFDGGFMGNVHGNLNLSFLNTYCKHYDLGQHVRCFWLVSRELWENVAQRNLKVTAGVAKFPIEKHNEIQNIMGRRFLGYEVGESDGYFISSTAPEYKPTSRREAQKLFRDSQDNTRAHHFTTALGSLNFPHEYGALGYRMLGYEDSQGLPSTMMRWAFLRGASKQYGLLSYSNISVFNRWGMKRYDKGGKWYGMECGPDNGPSLGLLKRLYYTIFLYGASSIGYETPYVSCVIPEKKDEEGYPKLSPLGEINVEAVKWCRKHSQDRGIQYTPVALLIDSVSGWVPPKHLYSGEYYQVWGNMPYEKGDYQIDNFFRWIYPQYEDCSYFRDERGYLTATPFGDKFDVLTSDVHQRILDQYQVACLLGELEMPPDLMTKLNEFVKSGGDLIVSASQAKILGAEFCGVIVSDKMRRGSGGLSLSDGKMFEEKDYIYSEVTPERAKVLAVSEDKIPLITVAESGKGRVIVITPEYWMTTRLKVDDEGDVHPQRYELLKVVQHILGQYFKDLDFIEVDGEEIQYIVNVTDNTKRLLVTLVNNSPIDDWQGSISLKTGKIVRAKELMEEKKLSTRKPIRISVPKGDLRVVEIISDEPLFSKKEQLN